MSSFGLKVSFVTSEVTHINIFSPIVHLADSNLVIPQLTVAREVKCQVATFANVHIPSPSLNGYPSTLTTDGDKEDWNTNMAALYEWVGMASLCSQRCVGIHAPNCNY